MVWGRKTKDCECIHVYLMLTKESAVCILDGGRGCGSPWRILIMRNGNVTMLILRKCHVWLLVSMPFSTRDLEAGGPIICVFKVNLRCSGFFLDPHIFLMYSNWLSKKFLHGL